MRQTKQSSQNPKWKIEQSIFKKWPKKNDPKNKKEENREMNL